MNSHAEPLPDIDLDSVAWFPQPNDLIGGWSIMTADKTPGNSDPRKGEIEVASFMDEKTARRIAHLHNESLSTVHEGRIFPEWVYILIAAVTKYEDEHAKGDDCLEGALIEVPQDQRTYASVMQHKPKAISDAFLKAEGDARLYALSILGALDAGDLRFEVFSNVAGRSVRVIHLPTGKRGHGASQVSAIMDMAERWDVQP